MNILITGSTDGIGKLAAIRFAKEGHTVFVHGRSTEKVKTLVKELKSYNNTTKFVGFTADFSDLSAVDKMAKDIRKSVSHLDIIINNAGIYKSTEHTNKRGLEIRFVVNYLAPYLLTRELLPLLKGGIDSRIINLSSAAQAPITEEAILAQKLVSENEAYAISKFALTMWSFHLAKVLENVTVIAVNPGSLLNTKMANEAYGQHWSPAEKGSNILYDLSIQPEHKNHSGEYFDNDSGAYAQAHPEAYNPTAIEELLVLTNNLIA